MNYSEVLDNIYNLYNEEKAKFDSKIIKTNLKNYGLKTDDVKRIAKKVLYSSIDENNLHKIYEIDLIYGLSVSYDKNLTLDNKLKLFANFFKEVDNWAVVDTVASSFKLKENDYHKILNFVKKYYKSEYEFLARFTYLLLFVNYVQINHLDDIFSFIDNQGPYYVIMAKAWLLQKIYLVDKNRVIEFLKTLDKKDKLFVFTIRKLLDSFKVSKEDKLMLKELRL